MSLTIGNGADVPATSKQVRAKNSNVDRKRDCTCPPTDDVANQVDLFLLCVLGPETDTTQEEGPVDGAACIWVGSGEPSVMLKHKKLQFGELLEEAHSLGLFWRNIGALLNIVSGCGRISVSS